MPTLIKINLKLDSDEIDLIDIYFIYYY
jgi:hypothetical protein